MTNAIGAGNRFYFSICPTCDNIHRNDEKCRGNFKK